MNEFYENLVIFMLVSPLLCYIIAVSFRLLDNSTLILLQQEILVNSSNVSIKCIRYHIQNSKDLSFKSSLQKALIFRLLHRVFLVLMFCCMPLTIMAFFILN
ncbi:hypothetical protein ACW6QP_02025 [Salegentibacter sp. HM20]